MSDESKLYTQRPIRLLNQEGNLFNKHLSAMTAEGLFKKSDIAAELAWRDYLIQKLTDENRRLSEDLKEIKQRLGQLHLLSKLADGGFIETPEKDKKGKGDED